MAYEGLTNSELIEFLDLPADIVDQLRTAQGTTWQAAKNQFLEALYNKVLYQTVASLDFENPFKKFDSFPVNFGDTIENIFVEMPSGEKFNPNVTNPFAKATPSVKSLYATINYELKYKTTVEDSLLRRATLNQYGFMNLIDTIVMQLAKSASIDEYFATIAMLNHANIYAKGFETITLPKENTKEDNAKLITEKIIDTVTSFELPKTSNNKLGVMQVTSKKNVLLVIKRTLLNSINLDYLSGVFNLNKVDLINNIIPVDTFQVAVSGQPSGTVVGDDLDFIILDTNGFDNHVALQDGGLLYNPESKYTNHYYHLWKIISYKYFYNARAFKTQVAV